MLNTEKAIKRIIEKYIISDTPLIQDGHIGDDTLHIQSARRYRTGDSIAIHDQALASSKVSDTQFNSIKCIIDNNTITLNKPLNINFPSATSLIQKTVKTDEGNSESIIEAVYTGDPDVIPKYPAITVEAKSEDIEWLTLESISTKRSIDITIYVTAADFQHQRELMMVYVDRIKSSLFRSLYPLVKPYYQTTLAEDLNVGDTIFKLTDQNFLLFGGLYIFFESVNDLRSGSARRYFGNGVYELMYPLDTKFFAGDTLIRPGRHMYNALPTSVQYGTVSKGTMLKAARISYFVTEETVIHSPYLDPMTF